MKRKKRLKKGIESLQWQIENHEEKLKAALAEGKEELARYYDKDISILEDQKKKKKDQLEKS